MTLDTVTLDVEIPTATGEVRVRVEATSYEGALSRADRDLLQRIAAAVGGGRTNGHGRSHRPAVEPAPVVVPPELVAEREERRARGTTTHPWSAEARRMALDLLATHKMRVVERATGINASCLTYWRDDAARAAAARAEGPPPAPATPSSEAGDAAPATTASEPPGQEGAAPAPAEPVPPGPASGDFEHREAPPATTPVETLGNGGSGQEGGAPGPVGPTGPMTAEEFAAEYQAHVEGEPWSMRARVFVVARAVEIGDGATAREVELRQPMVSRWRRQAGAPALLDHAGRRREPGDPATAPRRPPAPNARPVLVTPERPDPQSRPLDRDGGQFARTTRENLERSERQANAAAERAAKRDRPGVILPGPARHARQSPEPFEKVPPLSGAGIAPLPEPAAKPADSWSVRCRGCRQYLRVEVGEGATEQDRSLATHKVFGEHYRGSPTCAGRGER